MTFADRGWDNDLQIYRWFEFSEILKRDLFISNESPKFTSRSHKIIDFLKIGKF